MTTLRECDCPIWVIKCVHIDDGLLQMADIELTRVAKGLFPKLSRYCVGYRANPQVSLEAITTTDDLLGAEAVFLKAEQRLIELADGRD